MKLCKNCDYFVPDPDLYDLHNRFAKCSHPTLLDHVTGRAKSFCIVIRDFDCKDGKLFKPKIPEVPEIKISRKEIIEKKISSIITFLKKPLSEYIK